MHASSHSCREGIVFERYTSLYVLPKLTSAVHSVVVACHNFNSHQIMRATLSHSSVRPEIRTIAVQAGHGEDQDDDDSPLHNALKALHNVLAPFAAVQAAADGAALDQVTADQSVSATSGTPDLARTCIGFH